MRPCLGLSLLSLVGNQLPRLKLPDALPLLTALDVSYNPLISLTLPNQPRSLTQLQLRGARLTSLTLPDGLSSLTTPELYSNGPPGAFMPGFQDPNGVFLGANPLEMLSLPETSAKGGLATMVAYFVAHGVSVAT